MSDKPVAVLVTALAIAPICAVCVLGPAAFGSAVAWLSGWFGGLDLATTTGLAIVVALLIALLIRRKKTKVAAGADRPPDPSRQPDGGLQ